MESIQEYGIAIIFIPISFIYQSIWKKTKLFLLFQKHFPLFIYIKTNKYLQKYTLKFHEIDYMWYDFPRIYCCIEHKTVPSSKQSINQ